MRARTLVVRNAFALLVSQVITNVLSFVTVPLLARTLGSTDYGTWWLAGQVVGFGFLLVDLGQEGYVSLIVARDHERAPALLATTTVMRVAGSVLLIPVLEIVVSLLHFDAFTRTVTHLFWAASAAACIISGTTSILRGFERMGWLAFLRIAGEAIRTILIVGGIWIGARLVGLATLEVVAAVLDLAIAAWVIRRVRLRAAAPRWALVLELVRGGTPFLLWGGILSIQPSLEAVLLSKLASPEAVGWYAATGKLIGLLLVPATLLMGALGPTLARLQRADPQAFRRAAAEALRAALLMSAPFAVGTYLFADTVTAVVYGSRSFEPVATNLRVMSAYIIPVFINIALGTVLLVSGRQLAWALSKGVTVAVTAAASFFVIPYCQLHLGNGGIGAAVMTVASELAMTIVALALLPRNVVSRGPFLDAGRACVASAAMGAVAILLRRAPPGLTMTGSLVAYTATAVLVGAVRRNDWYAVRDALRRSVGAQGAADQAGGTGHASQPHPAEEGSAVSPDHLTR